MEEENILEALAGILEKYTPERHNLLPLLLEIQEECGYLPALVLEKTAEALGLPAVDLYGVATVFHRFRLHPMGRRQIKVCLGTACYLTGGEIALRSFERRLDIKVGETTPDGEISLEEVACLGCCSLAPAVQVDDLVEGGVTPTKVEGILLNLAGI